MVSVDEFSSRFNSVRDIILSRTQAHSPFPECLDWIKESMEYNIRGGKLIRGRLVVHSFMHFSNGHHNENELEDAFWLGWTVEFLQAAFLVADDIMDQSYQRRGKECWFRKPAVQYMAINDAFLIQSWVYLILNERFCGRNCYLELVELFRQTVFQTEMGQLSDLLLSRCDMSLFSLEKYKNMVRSKTAWYSFYLPLSLAVLLTGQSPDAFRSILPMSRLFGEYFQIQDDYLDCYGDPRITGKIGTDIQDGKCTWLAVKALELADQEQENVLRSNYGQNHPDSVAAVKQIYEQLRVQDLCKRDMDVRQKVIRDQISGMDTMEAKIYSVVGEFVFSIQY